jgi:O-antigen ligase
MRSESLKGRHSRDVRVVQSNGSSSGSFQRTWQTSTGQKVAPFTTGLLLVCASLLFEYVRPHDLIKALSALRLGLVVTAIAFACWFLKGDKKHLNDPVVRLYLVFLALMVFSIPFAVNNYWAYRVTFGMVVIAIGAVLPMLAFVDDTRALRLVTKVFVIGMTAAAVYGITHRGTGPGSFLSDENDLACVLNMGVPFAYFLSRSKSESGKQRMLWLLATGVLVAGTVSTMSRGGFIGLVAVAFGMIIVSGKMLRTTLIILCVGAAAYTVVPEHYIGEIISIQDTEDETRNERIYSWKRGWEMFLDHPILGVGVQNYPWRVAEYELKSGDYDPRSMRLLGGRVAHSVYFTLLPELGITGTLVYAVMVWILMRRLWRISHFDASSLDPKDARVDVILFAKAAVTAFVGFLFTGIFITVLYHPPFWHVIGYATALTLVWAKLSASRTEPRAPAASA